MIQHILSLKGGEIISKFIDAVTVESWRSVVDKIPVLGSKIVDKLTKPMLDKIMRDAELRKYIKSMAKKMFDEAVEDYKKEFPTGERKLSMTKPAKFEPLASEQDVRGIDDGMINYEYMIDNCTYRVTTDGSSIRRVYIVIYEYDRKSDTWYEEMFSLYAPSKDTLAKMWKPISDGEYLTGD